MKIENWLKPDKQSCTLGKNSWSVARLFELSRNLPVMEIQLNHLHLANYYEKLNLREMVMHMRAVLDADLNCPIILDEDGEIMDGRHRLMKAMLGGAETIKAVRFDENPPPCSRKE